MTFLIITIYELYFVSLGCRFIVASLSEIKASEGQVVILSNKIYMVPTTTNFISQVFFLPIIEKRKEEEKLH